MIRCYVPFALCCSIGLAGCNFSDVDGNGHRVQENRKLAAFSQIHDDADLDVELVQGDEQSLSVSIDSNLQHSVRTRVSGDTLYLDLRENVDRMVSGPHVRITLPQLTRAELAGSGSMTLAFDEPTLALALDLSGSGDLRFEGNAAAVTAVLDGAGEIDLAGETRDVQLSLSGSGAIRGRRLAAESADVDLSGSGDVSVNASESVRVSLSGSGRIDLYGDASVDGYDKSGSGELSRH
jgi:putative autotransporter adhesin-like protein